MGASGQSLGAPVHPSSAKRAHLTPAVTAFVAMLMRNDDCDGAKAEAVLTATAAVIASLVSLAPIVASSRRRV